MFAEVLFTRKISFGNDSKNDMQKGLTYSIPEALERQIQAGDLVEIELRKQKTTGIILKLSKENPQIAVKPIFAIRQSKLLSNWQLELLDWLSTQPKGKKHRILKKMIPDQIFEGKIDVKNFENQNQKNTAEKNLTKKTALYVPEKNSEKWKVLFKKIQSITQKNLQVLILTPEIDPLPPWTRDLELIAPTEIYHGKKTKKQLALSYKKIAENETKIIVGSKLAIFAPFKNIGLIIMTDADNSAYAKENLPEIHLREMILKIQDLTNCETVFETALPSTRLFEKSQKENWKIYWPPRKLKTTIIDLREEKKKKNFSLISEKLEEKLEKILEKNQQAILFLNRRGLGSSLLCRDCGHMEKCDRCSAAYTFHKGNILLCHACKNSKPAPISCPQCGNIALKFFGTGTEKIEEELKKIFPKTSIIRIDKDTVKHPKELDEVSRIFRNGLAKIVIGTNLMRPDLMTEAALTAAILPDATISYPGINSNEETLRQLNTLKSLTAENGEMLIQTHIPDHIVFETFTTEIYEPFYEKERKMRMILEMMQ